MDFQKLLRKLKSGIETIRRISPAVFLVCLMPAVLVSGERDDRRLKADSLYGEARYAEAFALFQEQLNTGASSPALYYRMGNCQYRLGLFSEALYYYEKIDSLDYESGDLYYNMGNTYYHLGMMDRAILFYERARRFKPGDRSLQENIQLARLRLGLQEIHPREFVVYRAFHRWVTLIPRPVLKWVVAGLYVVFMAFCIGWLLVRIHRVRRRLFLGCGVSGVLLFLFAISLFSQISAERRREGIIIKDNLSGLSGPGESATPIFSIPRGTKVTFQEETGDWLRVVLPNREVCWIDKSSVEQI
jgi:tetratricopeptide (TPR) repeat protein